MSPAPLYRVPMTTKYGSLDKSTPCIICCGRNSKLNIRHVHLSTQFYYKQSLLAGSTSPWCYRCNSEHMIDMMTRTKVFLSTSTINGVPFLEGWPGLSMHCDWETVPGAQLDTLRKVWERSYSQSPLPVDTILVGGLNDIKPIIRSINDPRAPLSSHTSIQDMATKAQDLFIERVRAIWHTMKCKSKEKGTNDTLAVCMVLHVPALYWHEHDKDFPHPDYTNYKPVIDAINDSIISFNQEIGSPHTPRLQRMGERTLGKGARVTYNWNRFREEDRWNMMHLADKYRIELATRLYKYFEHRAPKAFNYLE